MLLRDAGHEVYDFRNPASGNTGFAWSSIDREWLKWKPETYRRLISTHPTAASGFAFDKVALDWADTCVLLLPCGRSAHLEAGYACGQKKRVVIYLHEDKFEPELMYLLGTSLVCNDSELLSAVQFGKPIRRRTHDIT